jgi:hypothetical protein
MSGVLALFLSAAVAPAATAAGSEGGEGRSPAAYCRAHYEPLTTPVTGITFDQYVIPVEFSFGGQTVVEDFGLSSFQACVSTVASGMRADGVVPASAISSRRTSRSATSWRRPARSATRTEFYGVYLAEKRSDCARILQASTPGSSSCRSLLRSAERRFRPSLLIPAGNGRGRHGAPSAP